MLVSAASRSHSAPEAGPAAIADSNRAVITGRLSRITPHPAARWSRS